MSEANGPSQPVYGWTDFSKGHLLNDCLSWEVERSRSRQVLQLITRVNLISDWTGVISPRTKLSSQLSSLTKSLSNWWDGNNSRNVGFLFQEAQQQSFPLTQVEEFSLILKIKWSSADHHVPFVIYPKNHSSVLVLRECLWSWSALFCIS